MEKSIFWNIVFGIAFITIFSYLVYYTAIMQKKPNEEIYRKWIIVSKNAEGLFEGSPIFYKGKKVGWIDKMDYQIDRVVLTAYISKDIEITCRMRILFESINPFLPRRVRIVENDKNCNDMKIAVLKGEYVPSLTELISLILEENRKNLYDATTGFYILTKKLVDHKGTLGKVLVQDSLYRKLLSITDNLEKLVREFNEYNDEGYIMDFVDSNVRLVIIGVK